MSIPVIPSTYTTPAVTYSTTPDQVYVNRTYTIASSGVSDTTQLLGINALIAAIAAAVIADTELAKLAAATVNMQYDFQGVKRKNSGFSDGNGSDPVIYVTGTDNYICTVGITYN